MKKRAALLGLLLGSLNFCFSQTINLNLFASGFTKPLDIQHCGDDRLFVVEQTGRIKIINGSGTTLATPFLNLVGVVSPTGSERGLLGLAFHPDYAENGYFFVNYTDLLGDTRIARYKVSSADPNVADPGSATILLTIDQPFSNHNGGWIGFGPDGFLYISMGDGGSAGDPDGNGQNTGVLLGKMLRIDVNNPAAPFYFSPPTNPFAGVVAGKDEIWAYGLRNAWRNSFDRITGDLWIADVGQDAWEEINFQPSTSPGGENYGWDCREGFVQFSIGCTPMPTDTVSPVHTISHTDGNCSVTGGYVYRGAQWADLWGYYFYIDYCTGIIHSIKSNGSGGWIFNDNVLFVTPSSLGHSTFGQDYLGELYLANLSTGNIFQISGNVCGPVAFISMEDSVTGCDSLLLSALGGDGLSYQWYDGGSPVSTNTDIYAQTNGWYKVVVTNASLCADSDSVYVSIYPSPIVDITTPDTLLCQYHPELQLIGNPPGGTFSGSGVIPGDYFNPDTAGVGAHIVDYLYTSSGTGCTGASQVTVTVDSCLSVSEISSESGIKLFPNPARESVHISFGKIISQEITCEIFGLNGSLLRVETILKNEPLTGIEIKTNDLAPGTYFVRLNTRDGIFGSPLIIQ